MDATTPSNSSRDRLVRVDRTDPKAVARTRAIIRLLYRVHDNSRTPLHQIRKNKRFCELETVFAHYWRGAELPDDDAGRECLYVAACHLWHLGKKCGAAAAIEFWAQRWAPWCGADELAALIERVEAYPRKWKADPMADELGLLFAMRQALGLTTIGSIDVRKAERKKRRGKNSKQRSTEKRRQNGSVSRAEYITQSKSRTKPWEALGISRRTSERHKARETDGVASANAPKNRDILVCSDLRHGESHESQPWLELGISRATYYRRQRCKRAPEEAAR